MGTLTTPRVVNRLFLSSRGQNGYLPGRFPKHGDQDQGEEMYLTKSRKLRLMLVLGLLMGSIGVAAQPAAAADGSGALFTMTNAASNNEVLV